MSGGGFLTQPNYDKVVSFLQQHYAGRMGMNAIPERLDTRIKKTVQHYMTEVAKVRGVNGNMSVMNQEVLREANVSIDTWMKRQDQPPNMKGVSQPPPQPPPFQRIAPPAPVSLKQAATVPPSPVQSSGSNDAFLTPDFRYSMDEDEDPVVIMKRIQREREEEARSQQPRMEVQEVEEIPAQTQPAPERLAPLPQDYIIPQEDVIKYRETEYNIFLTSGDRDWTRNKGENRYNFSVTFNAGNRPGYGLSPALQQRFKNIQRIEFVKAILPTESLTSLVRVTQTEPSVVTNTDRVVNLFSLPFVAVRIAELNGNGFSTNPREDNTFAIVQYDSTWDSDTTNNSANPSLSRVGYTGFIPKHLKCQRIYEPTPLTNLQKMSIRIERHDSTLLNDTSDLYSVQRICLSGDTTGIAGTTNSVYAQADNSYIFIQTSTYFPYSGISEGDSINIQGYTVATGTSPPSDTTRNDFQNFINSPGSHYVVAIAYVDSGTIYDGSNSVGYSNILILRSRFDDPTTGSTGRTNSYFGGSVGEEGALEALITDQPSTASTAGLINLSRQTHIVLRIITRDFDASSNIRPDNI